MKNLKDYSGFKKFVAFSLVELMISLITISCIAAAFTPVITKKLKKQDIALSIAQTSEITSNCGSFGDYCELCTSKYCIKCSLDSCGSGEFVDTQSCSCKSCKNDANLNNCLECKKENNDYICLTCEGATTSSRGYYLTDVDNKKYNICQPCGKDKISGKNNYCFDGIYEKGPDYCLNPPYGHFCDGDSLKLCSSKYSIDCATCDETKCKTCVVGKTMDNSGKCVQCRVGGCDSCSISDLDSCLSCSAFHVVYSSNGKQICKACGSVMEHCTYCSGNVDIGTHKCTACEAGYYISSDGKSCVSCSNIANCIGCDAVGCTKCAKGLYVAESGSNKGKCVACNIVNCAQCDTKGNCTACNPGYYLKNNSCAENNSAFNCSDSNFMKIGNLCVTRKNMGDSGLLKIPSNVTIAESGNEYCSSHNQKCCWKGDNSTVCDDVENPSYSGCKRTVCNWYAANEICNNFNYAGKKWRLATMDEMKNWAVYSIALGNNGLQLCDLSSGFYSNRCAGSAACLGSGRELKYCEVYNFWSGDEQNSNYAKQFLLYQGRWQSAYYNKACAHSVRCVTEMDD